MPVLVRASIVYEVSVFFKRIFLRCPFVFMRKRNVSFVIHFLLSFCCSILAAPRHAVMLWWLLKRKGKTSRGGCETTFYSREFTFLRSRQQTEQLLPTEAAFELPSWTYTDQQPWGRQKEENHEGDAGHGAVWDTYRFGQEKSIWRKGEMIE